MSALTVPTYHPDTPGGSRPAIDDVGGVRFTRLVGVELRKLVDTRSGRWLLIAIVGVTAIAMGAVMWVNRADGARLMPLLLAANLPQAILLPVLGVMTAANEWSQRTALITFTQEPRRLRVMSAKLVAAALLALGVLAVTILLAVGSHVLSASLASGGSVDLSVTAAFWVNILLVQLQGVLLGVAFGSLLLNVPLGIVTYFLVPALSQLFFGLTAWLRENAAWFDMGAAGQVLLGDDWPTRTEWAQIGTTTAVWMLLPLAIGLWRVSRKEVA